jgi:hypothetical protein
MSVYVDRAFLKFGRLVCCHMIADSPAELHATAELIGLLRRWYQTPPRASFWHYDVSMGMRTAAVAHGAIDCDRNTFVDHLRRIHDSKVFGDLVAINREARR